MCVCDCAGLCVCVCVCVIGRECVCLLCRWEVVVSPSCPSLHAVSLILFCSPVTAPRGPALKDWRVIQCEGRGKVLSERLARGD